MQLFFLQRPASNHQFHYLTGELSRGCDFDRDSASSLSGPKAPLVWTALILDVCEETTIETNQRNSFNTSYGVKIAEILISRITTNMQ